MRSAKEKPSIIREPRSRLLTLDPTPPGLITEPLRKVAKTVWKRLRDEHFKGGDFSCDLCNTDVGKAKFIDAHEVYSFPSRQLIQLERVVFLCKKCHDAIHFARSKGRNEDTYIRDLVAHYCKLDVVTEDEMQQDFCDTGRQMIEIQEFYGGPAGTAPVHYGVFQKDVDEILAKRRKKERPLLSGDTEAEEDVDNDILPDEEFPEATAMWRDTFG